MTKKYKVTMHYYYRDYRDNSKPIGLPQRVCIYGDTIAELNKNIQERKDNHDVFKCLPYMFDSIEELR